MPSSSRTRGFQVNRNAREGGLLRCLGARSPYCCCLDPIPLTDGGEGRETPVNKSTLLVPTRVGICSGMGALFMRRALDFRDMPTRKKLSSIRTGLLEQ